MKKIFTKVGLIAAVMLYSSMSFAQSGLKKAEEQYKAWAYDNAIDIYNEIESKGFNHPSVLKQLGDAFFFNGKYEDAHKQYNNLFKLFDIDEIESIYVFRYAQTLQSVGEKEKAEKYFNIYKNRLGENSQISKVNADFKLIEEQLKKNSGRYSELLNLPINSEYSDYGSFVHQNHLYFTTNRDTGSFSKKLHTWTGNQFTKLYKSPINNDIVTEVERINSLSTSNLNEATAVITKDGKTMYFTRNNSVNGKRKYSDKDRTLLKIYRATLVDGTWKNVEELPFNSNEYNTAHPALSPDERYLYFSSDRVGGYGQSDLWRVSIATNGTFGVPENLGPEINTEGRETFPFVSGANELYFSTDGRLGFGALDVYIAEIKDDNTFANVQNLGTPVNSAYDDFAYYINSNTKRGYVSSNRTGGKGSDDIYAFVEQRPIEFGCSQGLRIFVSDKDRQPITEAELTLFDQNNRQVATTSSITNEYQFKYNFECGAMYKVAVNKDKYDIQEVKVVLPEESGVTEKSVVLNLTPVKVVPPKPVIKEGDNLFEVLKLNKIYFDYNKDNIRPDAALELAKIVEIMKEYPKMEIDVRSHTDSRGSDAYNLKLSQRRAKSTANWIIANGIDKSRVTYKGYGETQLVNKCKNGVKCSDEEHEENRRSQFIIKKVQ